jgi:hypothetical protein
MIASPANTNTAHILKRDIGTIAIGKFGQSALSRRLDTKVKTDNATPR